MGVFENRGTLFRGPFERNIFYLEQNRGTPILGKPQDPGTKNACAFNSQSKLLVRNLALGAINLQQQRQMRASWSTGRYASPPPPPPPLNPNRQNPPLPPKT